MVVSVNMPDGRTMPRFHQHVSNNGTRVCRLPARYRTARILLLAFVALACREEIPLGGSSGSSKPTFRFTPDAYYSFDNWKLDPYGMRIPSSYYRSSWTVADTGVRIRGALGVVVVIDSTFDSTGMTSRVDSLFLRVDDNGDLLQYGFLSSLIAERESLTIMPQWDRIAVFSVPNGASWVVARLDTSTGLPSDQVVVGRVSPMREYVGPVSVNNEERAVLSYRIEITKPHLDFIFWLSEAPPSFPRMIDDSDIIPLTTVKELKIYRSPH